jgi:hypothetical protein
LKTSYQPDGFLKAHAIWIDYTMEDPAHLMYPA